MDPSLALKSLRGVLMPRGSLSLQLSTYIEGLGVLSSGAQEIREMGPSHA